MKLKHKITKIVKNEYFLLGAILTLAYLLRILPYILGYDLPISNDAFRDLEQVKHLIETGSINFGSDYGSFPVLHLIVYLLFLAGIPLMESFLLFPQILPVLGIFFFYLFLKKHFSKNVSLISIFLLATFSPLIYWSAQPVRETIGLFLFPLTVFLFDKTFSFKEINAKNKEFILYLILTSFTFVALILSHNWSTLMTLAFLASYSIFFISEKVKRTIALLTITIMASLTLLYWVYALPLAFKLLNALFKINAIALAIIPAIVIAIIAIKKFNLEKLKDKTITKLIGIIVLSISIILFVISPFSYPPQTLLNPIIFLAIISLGIPLSRNNKNMNKLVKCSIPYVLILAIPIIFIVKGANSIGQTPSFDPLRTFEFIIFALVPLGAITLNKLYKNKKTIFFIIILLIMISSVFIYPTVFITKNSFETTPFYDIRSDIRYISPKTSQLIEHSHSKGYEVISNQNVVNKYEELFYPKKNQSAILITSQDMRVAKKYEDVNDKTLGIKNPQNLIDKTKNMTVLSQNEHGKLYI